MPAGTADRGEALKRRRWSRFPTSGAARESTTTSFSRPRSSPGRGRAGRYHGNRSRPLASRRYRGGFTGVASIEAADRAPVEMRGGLHCALHGARPLRPAFQPATARVSG